MGRDPWISPHRRPYDNVVSSPIEHMYIAQQSFGLVAWCCFQLCKVVAEGTKPPGGRGVGMLCMVHHHAVARSPMLFS